jgi:hypothetical protein
MANVSVAVEIETRIKHDLSIVFQAVASDQTLNVGTLLTSIQLSAIRVLRPATDDCAGEDSGAVGGE